MRRRQVTLIPSMESAATWNECGWTWPSRWIQRWDVSPTTAHFIIIWSLLSVKLWIVFVVFDLLWWRDDAGLALVKHWSPVLADWYRMAHARSSVTGLSNARKIDNKLSDSLRSSNFVCWNFSLLPDVNDGDVHLAAAIFDPVLPPRRSTHTTHEPIWWLTHTHTHHKRESNTPPPPECCPVKRVAVNRTEMSVVDWTRCTTRSTPAHHTPFALGTCSVTTDRLWPHTGHWTNSYLQLRPPFSVS